DGLARADLAGLAQLRRAIDADHAAGHQRLAGAAAVANADQLEQLVQFHMLALELEIDGFHPRSLARARGPAGLRHAPALQALQLAPVDVPHAFGIAEAGGLGHLALRVLQLAVQEVRPRQSEMERVLAALDADGALVACDRASVVALVLAFQRE